MYGVYIGGDLGIAFGRAVKSVNYNKREREWEWRWGGD